MKLDFREIERQLVEWFPCASDTYIVTSANTGDKIAVHRNVPDGFDDEINPTELAKHLTDFINQRGDRP